MATATRAWHFVGAGRIVARPKLEFLPCHADPDARVDVLDLPLRLLASLYNRQVLLPSRRKLELDRRILHPDAGRCRELRLHDSFSRLYANDVALAAYAGTPTGRSRKVAFRRSADSD